MKTDLQLKKDIEKELEWDPAVNAADIGVEVHDRIVTLSGHLDNYGEKLAARKAALRVEGIKGLVVEMDVRVKHGDHRTDEEIATIARSVLQWSAGLSEHSVHVSVEQGHVILSGEVDWGYQVRTAESVISPLRGVVSVVNQIQVRQNHTPANIAERIGDALRRHAETEAKRIDVTVSEGTVTLRGHVDTLPEKTLICNVAWSAPGVHKVVDEMSVGV